MLSNRLILIWLLGTVVLLPVDLIHLPLNMSLVDGWVVMALPMLWLLFMRRQYPISLTYTVPMWLIFLASFISTLGALAPRNGLIVILKEIYAYIWFITLIAVLARSSARTLHRVLVAWAATVLLHGFVILGQFLSPELWRLTMSLAGGAKFFEVYRPSGLFVNANPAALFQLLGFVPLVLVSRSQKVGVILGSLVLLSLMATGSMGATLAFLSGLAVALMAIFWSGHLRLILKMFVRMAIILSLLAGLLAFVVSHNERYQEHFERILIGRSEKSSGGRFDLWRRGLDAFLDHDTYFWGVGPENFREVDAKMADNQLHNEFLAFLVERGLLGTLGLALFAVIAVSRAASMFLIAAKDPERAPLTVVVFLAAMIAILVESLTHQVFHFRELWLILALQEAMLFKLAVSGAGVEPATRPVDGPLHPRRRFAVQPDVTGS